MPAGSPSTRGRPRPEQPTLWQLRWRWIPGPEAAREDDLITACVELYSEHYGKWGPKGVNPGGSVRMEPDRFVRLIDDEATWLACAYADGSLIGYCVAVRADIEARGGLAWVSQLVVHSSYRKARVATKLLYSVWQFSDCFAWGLATANPFAIRALETATRRPCRWAMITKHGQEVLEYVQAHVPYLPATLVVDDGRLQPRVNTMFFLDHSRVPAMQHDAARVDRPWALGNLAEGHEWLGCTFAEQPPQAMDDQRLDDLLTGADDIWIQAYDGMTLDESHKWHRHATCEAELVLTLSGANAGAAILDVGCGDGRHAEVLTGAGFSVTGVDISEQLIAKARQRVPGAVFEVEDARKSLPDGPFDLAICLYDVIGSSANADDDLVLARNIAGSLAPGGYLIASLMNTSVTLNKLAPEHKPKTNSDFIAALETLPPSSTMETSGSIFDPDLLVLFDGIYYRKEQFQEANWRLPAELVVRDRRFTASEVATLMERAGFEVVEIRPVQAGKWDRQPPLSETDERAKELLVVARRRL
jgi:2-polyprenyl-3-methyl-5-hydroxy-6-metoxy-1,4-benzoquinol methylase/GNAT superfamily N-acetyltransferase